MHRLLDELLAVYVVFRTPFLEDATLKAYLARLVVNVEAFAFSTTPLPEQDPKAGPLKELLYSGTIKHTDEPTIVNHGEGDAAHTYVIWKVDIFIGEICMYPMYSWYLTRSSSSSGEVSQTCGILPAYSILQASGKAQTRDYRRRVPVKPGPNAVEYTSGI